MTRITSLALSVFALTFSANVFAATEESTLSIREQATQETSVVEGKNQSKSTDAAQGILSLNDPRMEVITRTWKYYISLSAQQFSPRGSATNDYNSTVDLDGQSKTIMPALGFGFQTRDMQLNNVRLGFGLGAQFGYASQEVNFTMPNGYRIDDVRLNTTELSAQPFITLGAASWTKMDLVLGGAYGNIGYTQTSSDRYAKFSKQASFWGASVGVDYHVNNNWTLLTKYTQKSLTSKSEDGIDVQANNIELGTKVLW